MARSLLPTCVLVLLLARAFVHADVSHAQAPHDNNTGPSPINRKLHSAADSTNVQDASTGLESTLACPDGKPPAMCKMSPCKPNTCNPDELCVINKCGGCKWTCKKAPAKQHPAQRCINGSVPAVCDKNPCAATLCAPGTMCKVDGCDGCKAVCAQPANRTTTRPSLVNATNIVKHDQRWPPQGVSAHPVARCKDGSRPVQCLLDPCKSKKCGEGEVCKSGYCGGCNATCQPVAVSTPTAGKLGACADGSSPVQCLLDPCKSHKCGEGEVCESDYCGGCNAVCQPASAPVKSKPSTCADGSSPVQCLMDPCISATCLAGDVCEADYCGDCKAVCKKPAPGFSPVADVGKPKTCADGSSPVQCLVDPCSHKKCADGEVCESNHCGGCNAVCQPAPPSPWEPAPTTCSDGSEPVNCFVDPCEAKKCADGELCVRDYCGGCNAACQPAPAPVRSKPSTCADGSSPVQCLVDPCISATCLAGEVCEADYCGECKAVCKKPSDSLSTRSEPAPGACADGSRPMACLVDPCSTARCGYGLVCESNYCGGCNAVCKER